eukprot:12501397-Alexandrium_andersonii.AAC.1
MSVHDRCAFCDAPRADTFHLLWHCPRFEAHRERALAALGELGLDPQSAPRVLMQYGLAPATIACSEGPLWAGGEESSYVFDAAVAGLVGGIPIAERTVQLVGQLMRGSV